MIANAQLQKQMNMQPTMEAVLYTVVVSIRHNTQQFKIEYLIIR